MASFLCLAEGIARLPVAFLPSTHVAVPSRRTWTHTCDLEFAMSIGRRKTSWLGPLLGCQQQVTVGSRSARVPLVQWGFICLFFYFSAP